MNFTLFSSLVIDLQCGFFLFHMAFVLVVFSPLFILRVVVYPDLHSVLSCLLFSFSFFWLTFNFRNIITHFPPIIVYLSIVSKQLLSILKVDLGLLSLE